MRPLYLRSAILVPESPRGVTVKKQQPARIDVVSEATKVIRANLLGMTTKTLA